MRSGSVPLMLALSLVLGCWKGYLAMFSAGETEPKQIFPVAIHSLPETDRLALEEGIVIRSRSHLEQLMETYLG